MKLKKIFALCVVVITLVAVFLALAAPVMAAPIRAVQAGSVILVNQPKADVIPFNSVIELLEWLVYSGGSILAASWILDRIPSFKNGTLSPDSKNTIFTAVAIALALAFYSVLTYVPADVLAKLNPFFLVVMGTIVLLSGGKAYHALTKQ